MIDYLCKTKSRSCSSSPQLTRSTSQLSTDKPIQMVSLKLLISYVDIRFYKMQDLHFNLTDAYRSKTLKFYQYWLLNPMKYEHQWKGQLQKLQLNQVEGRKKHTKRNILRSFPEAVSLKIPKARFISILTAEANSRTGSSGM